MQYNISQLSDGVYNHVVTEPEFRADDDVLVKNLNVQVKFDKAFDSLHVTLHAEFETGLSCDRCLDVNTTKLSNSYSFVYSKNPDFAENTEAGDEIRFLPSDQNIIDVKDDIVQTILLGIPMKNVCRDDCKGLCAVCGTNKNSNSCNCTEKSVDPRWESLLKIKVD